MKVELRIDKKRIRVKDLLALEDAREGGRPTHLVTDILARLMVNGNGEYMEPEEALATLAELDLEQMEEVTQSLGEKLKELQATAVPPASGGSS